MNLTIEGVLIVGSFLLFISILASNLSAKLEIPALLIFLAIGMLAGPDGLVGIRVESPYMVKMLGTITLTLILFSGGLETDYSHIRPIIWHSVSLSTVGVLVTAVSIGYFIYWITAFSLIQGLLVGAIVSSTDAAAVFSILRFKNLNLKENLAPTLELESGSNDAMAYFLMIFFTDLLSTSQHISPLAAIPRFFQEMLIGGAMGLAMGQLMLWVVNKVQLVYQALYPGLTLSLILFTSAITNSLHGSGFLAVYIAGIVLGSQNFIHKKSLIRFYDGIAWLMQAVMFIVLGLLVEPHKLIPITGIGILTSGFLMLIARPVSVFISLAFNQVTFNAKVFLSWVGLRGAVPIIFAIHPLLMRVDKADMIFHIVFFIVFSSVLLQGTTLYPLAKWLQLANTDPDPKAFPMILAESVGSKIAELLVPQDAKVAGKKIVEIGFPKGALIVLIKRAQACITPQGNTTLEPGDKLMIMMDDQEDISVVKACLGIM